MDLFWQYQAFCEASGLDPAAFSTFRRVMKRVFSSHLKFRDKGDFGQCDTCHRLRKRIRTATTKSARAMNVRIYSQHLLQQWADRQFYWNMRALSRNYFQQALHFSKRLSGSDLASSVVTVIQDGMDQAKLRLPKWGYSKLSKAATKLYRPATHLLASWIHGFRLYLYLSDEDLKKDSETQLEALCLSLQHLFDHGASLAMTLHLQQDNCPREGKNRYVLGFMLLLQVLGVFRYTVLGFLRTAHSHDDVDQVFGQVARLLMGKTCQSASQMINVLEQCIDNGQPAERSGRIRGSEASVSKLDEVTAWKKIVAQLGLSFKGLRNVHYMRFCCRRDLGSDVLDNVQELEEYGGRWEPHADDVFLVTKKWLSDTEVTRALVAVPASMAHQIRCGHHPPGGIANRRTIGEQVQKNLQKRVPICVRSGEVSEEGARYLLGWSRGTLPRKPRPASYTFLGHRWSQDMRSERHEPGRWQQPRRVKHFDLTLAGDHVDSDSSDSDGPVNLPIALAD